MFFPVIIVKLELVKTLGKYSWNSFSFLCWEFKELNDPRGSEKCPGVRQLGRARKTNLINGRSNWWHMPQTQFWVIHDIITMLHKQKNHWIGSF